MDTIRSAIDDDIHKDSGLRKGYVRPGLKRGKRL